jgi:branched-chain amino acid transport system permease protein
MSSFLFALLGPRSGVAPASHLQAERLLDSPLRWTGVALLVATLVTLPLLGSTYWIYMASLSAIMTISVTGLNILTGSAGLLSIGHAAFVGVGAFSCAILHERVGVPFWAAIPLSGLAAAAMGVLVGLPSLRIKGLYLAIATLAAQYLFLFLAQRWESVTGGDAGLKVTPPEVLGRRLDSDVEMYLLVMPVAALMCLFAVNLSRTRTGRAFVAVRERDYSAEVLGVHLLRTKLTAFAVAAFYAGVSGSLMAFFFRVVSPSQFTFDVSILQLTAVIVGGLGSVLGSILGSLFMMLVPEVLKAVLHALSGAQATSLAVLMASARELVFGLLIVGFLLFEPYGLAEIVRRVRVSLDVWPFRN